jgi:pimeloyl-ACP methyl ester carboxylesterase
VLGVAGVPGDTFASLLGPLPVPRFLRRPLGNAASQLMSLTGGALDLVTNAVPTEATTWLLRHIGVALPSASPAYVNAVVEHLMTHEFAWYFRLAHGCGAHRRVDLAKIEQPVTLLGGRWDILTSAKHIGECAELIPNCDFQMLNASHFLPVEKPEVCEEALHALADRAYADSAAA